MHCYMLRHQHAGIITSHVFTSPPTAEQLAPIIAECGRLHGREGWTLIHEAELLSTEIPSFPDRAPAPASVSTAIVSAVGSVESNPEESDPAPTGGLVSRIKGLFGKP